MESQRLKVKVGPHEFEAEGPPDAVAKQFSEWREMISAVPVAKPENDAKPVGAALVGVSATAQPGTLGFASAPPTVIMESVVPDVFITDTKRNIVSLRVHPTGESRNADAALLILYGYRRLLQREEVLAGHIKDSLDESGIRIDRVDRTLGPYTTERLLLKAGMGKGGKYRLTQTGYQRAETLAKSLADQMV
jgi:hypothetical protein